VSKGAVLAFGSLHPRPRAIRSLNLNVHFHVVVLDGVFSRDADRRVAFRAASPPTIAELEAIVHRVRDRALGWLRRRGLLDERPAEERSNEAPEPAAIEACAAIAMQRGAHATLPSEGDDAEEAALEFERDGFNLHAGVRIEAGDDVGRERLCRYGARPALSLQRLPRLPGGRFAYRVKYARGGRAKHRVMTSMELLARLAALIPPPRHPLVGYSGVIAPRSAWRKDVVPKPLADGGSTTCESHAETTGGGRADARTPAPDVPRSDVQASATDARRTAALRHVPHPMAARVRRSPSQRPHPARVPDGSRRTSSASATGSGCSAERCMRRRRGSTGRRFCVVHFQPSYGSARRATGGYACAAASPSAMRCAPSSSGSRCRPRRRMLRGRAIPRTTSDSRRQTAGDTRTSGGARRSGCV
jgi:Putative transposase